jgi:hypothetical protein
MQRARNRQSRKKSLVETVKLIGKGRVPRIKLIRGTVRSARKLRRALEKACPNLPQKVINAMAIDLADISEIGAKHNEYLRWFLRMRFPEDLDRAEKLLINWIEVELLFHNQWHLSSLKREMPKLLRGLSKALPDRSKERPSLTR